MAFVRCYTGTDGQSHFEDLDLLPPDMERSRAGCQQYHLHAFAQRPFQRLAQCAAPPVPCATGATADDVAMRLEQGFRIIMTAPVRSTPGLVEGRRLAAR